MPPISSTPGLYLHVPFCSAICPYCDFAVTTGGAERRERFARSLIAEIRRDHGSWDAFDTVYLGGGTPSALGDEQLARILEAVRISLPLVPGDAGTSRPSEPSGASGIGGTDDSTAIAGLVISIEANPEDVTEARVQAWASLGIGRLSLGVQSFDRGALEFLGRRHSPDEARRAVEIGLASGMTVSLDLIYGLPNQAPSSWQEELAVAVSFAPHHISCYQLTIEPGTPFGHRSRRGEILQAAPDEVAALFYLTHRFLAQSGYPAYEVSNFASAPRNRCQHNRKYWEGASYLGLGPSAHSFDGRQRWWNQRAESAWSRDLEFFRRPVAEFETLSPDQLALEALMLGLRTPVGVNLGSLAGIDRSKLLEKNSATLSRLSEQDLLHLVDDERLTPTLRGMAQADALARSIEL